MVSTALASLRADAGPVQVTPAAAVHQCTGTPFIRSYNAASTTLLKSSVCSHPVACSVLSGGCIRCGRDTYYTGDGVYDLQWQDIALEAHK